MSSFTNRAGNGALSVPFLMQVDAGCDRFENAWHVSDRPDIGASMNYAIPQIHERLFWDLLTLELEFLINRRASVDPATYRERFSQYAAIITLFSSSMPHASSRDDRTSSTGLYGYSSRTSPSGKPLPRSLMTRPPSDH